MFAKLSQPGNIAFHIDMLPKRVYIKHRTLFPSHVGNVVFATLAYRYWETKYSKLDFFF